MQLSTYIKDLLYRHECVIIPGFGAFLAQHRSAHIDRETDTLYPPGKTILYNRQLQTNDGLLANYIASVDGSTYEIALAKLRHFTGKLSLDLAEGNTVSLETIGDFVLNSEKSVQFTPYAKATFSTGSFGLSSFVSSTIQRKLEAITEEETTLLFTPETRETRPYLRYAAIALLAVGVAGFIGFNSYKSTIDAHNFTEKQKADALVERQIQEATFIIDAPLTALNLTVPKKKGNYHIVAGAFRIQENADKKIEQLSQRGFNATYIGENKYGLHQVVYSSHEDRLDALKTLRSIKKTENKDAWLLVQKLD